jgi:hypothetical protein
VVITCHQGNKKGGEYALRLFYFLDFLRNRMLKSMVVGSCFHFLSFFVAGYRKTEANIHDGRICTGPKKPHNHIRLLKSIRVGIIVAAILAMISVLAS